MRLNELRQLLENATWFASVGKYIPEHGQVAIPHLSAWDSNQFTPDLDKKLADVAAEMDWLPSSHSQPDPIHAKRLAEQLLAEGIPFKEEVMASYKVALRSLHGVADNRLCSGPNNFTGAAVGAASYCARMATMEAIAGAPGFWHAALVIYSRGNWPCGLLSDGTLVVY